MKKEKKEKPHYVNNAKFSDAVVEYVSHVNECVSEGKPKPIVTDYIASCFMKISEGLSQKANFVRYTYREEMVMDAVENCLKAINNYDVEKSTRTGKPNAFSYFTQIAWFAFLRRLEKEKRQQDIKLKYLAESGLAELVSEEIESNEASQATQAYVDELRNRIEVVRDRDKVIHDYSKKEKTKRKSRPADSDLSEFLGD